MYIHASRGIRTQDLRVPGSIASDHTADCRVRLIRLMCCSIVKQYHVTRI